MKWHGGAWLYRVCRKCRDGSSFMWHQPCQCCKYTTKTRYKKLVTHVESHASTVSLLESGEQHDIKVINNDSINSTKIIASRADLRSPCVHFEPMRVCHQVVLTFISERGRNYSESTNSSKYQSTQKLSLIHI